MQTKICGKCKQEKSITEFYTHKRNGYQSRCKDCKRIDSRIYNRLDKRKIYNRQFYDELKNMGYFEEYSQRPEVKIRKANQMATYREDPILQPRFNARRRARTLKDNGAIHQQPCQFCGNPNSEMHHPNYDKPQYVIWLCRLCHINIRSEAKAEQ